MPEGDNPSFWGPHFKYHIPNQKMNNPQFKYHIPTPDQKMKKIKFFVGQSQISLVI
jgi:hypothetical protein